MVGPCRERRQAREICAAVADAGRGHCCPTPSGANTYSFAQRQISQQLHPDLPPTPFWAYDDGSGLAGQSGSFGMAVVAQTGTPTNVSFTHNLPSTYPSWIPVDTDGYAIFGTVSLPLGK